MSVRVEGAEVKWETIRLHYSIQLAICVASVNHIYHKETKVVEIWSLS